MCLSHAGQTSPNQAVALVPRAPTAGHKHSTVSASMNVALLRTTGIVGGQSCQTLSGGELGQVLAASSPCPIAGQEPAPALNPVWHRSRQPVKTCPTAGGLEAEQNTGRAGGPLHRRRGMSLTSDQAGSSWARGCLQSRNAPASHRQSLWSGPRARTAAPRWIPDKLSGARIHSRNWFRVTLNVCLVLAIVCRSRSSGRPPRPPATQSRPDPAPSCPQLRPCRPSALSTPRGDSTTSGINPAICSKRASRSFTSGGCSDSGRRLDMGRPQPPACGSGALYRPQLRTRRTSGTYGDQLRRGSAVTPRNIAIQPPGCRNLSPLKCQVPKMWVKTLAPLPPMFWIMPRPALDT